MEYERKNETGNNNPNLKTSKYVTDNGLKKMVDVWYESKNKIDTRLEYHDLLIDQVQSDTEELTQDAIKNYEIVNHLQLTVMWLLLIEAGNLILSFIGFFN